MEKKRGNYKCRVLSLVPGTTEWYNVKHDGEDDIRINT